MSILKLYIKIIYKINSWTGKILSYLALFIFEVILIEVFLRYIFNSPTIWANELSQLIFGVYCILAGGPLLASKGHLNVDLIYSRFSLKGKAVVDVLTFLLFVMFCGALIYASGAIAWDSISIVEHSESPWNPPIYPFKSAIVIGAVMLMLQGIADLICNIYTVVTGKTINIEPET